MEELQARTVSLREIRNVPESINVAIDFLRLHRKSLGRLVLTRVLPLIVFGRIILLVLGLGDGVSGLMYGAGSSLISLQMLLFLLCSGVGFLLIIALAFSTLKLAERHGSDEFSTHDIWREAKASFMKVLGTNLGLIPVAGFISSILSFLSMLLLAVPVISGLTLIFGVLVASTIWSLYYPARFLGECGFFESFRMSQYLVRGKFWATAFLLLVWMLQILGISSLSYFLSVLIATGVIEPLWIMENEVLVTGVLGVLDVVLGSVITLLWLPFLLSLGFHYYSQLERKEYPSFDEELKVMGQSAQEEVTAEENSAGGEDPDSSAQQAASPTFTDENIRDDERD